MSDSSKNLIVIAGPTAVGKTDFAIRLAKKLQTEIISADSRQMYAELTIGTAKPKPEQLAEVKHHFIGNLSINEYYNAARYEVEVLALLDKLFMKYDQVVMVGGSGLYIDAVCQGIDELPDADQKLRHELNQIYKKEGIDKIREKLQQLDPEFYEIVDQSNPLRMIRALEVCITTGTKYSSLRTNSKKQRNFRVSKIALNIERSQLIERINNRVDQMLSEGLLEEIISLKAYKNLNALNTVGYKEFFEYFSEKMTLEDTIEKIKTNSRRYAKRQLTWFRKDKSYRWFEPEEFDEVLQYLNYE